MYPKWCKPMPAVKQTMRLLIIILPLNTCLLSPNTYNTLNPNATKTICYYANLTFECGARGGGFRICSSSPSFPWCVWRPGAMSTSRPLIYSLERMLDLTMHNQTLSLEASSNASPSKLKIFKRRDNATKLCVSRWSWHTRQSMKLPLPTSKHC